MMLYLRLFAEFFCTGLFSVGGGLATIPFLQDMGQRTGWFTSHDLANMIAISESTPGPMGVNMATYVGFTSAGIPGSAIATLGLITPSIIVIIIVATVLRRFRDSKYVGAAFYGLRPASTGLIAAAGWSVISISLLDLPGWQAASCSPCSTGAVCWWRRQSWCSPGSSPPKNCIPSSGFSSPPGQASCSSSEHSGYKTTKRSVPL